MSEALGIELPSRPYPGLRPFHKTEWPLFFGREPMSQDVIGRLIAKSLVAVHGDSGCGKSSLIEAGVLPVLERDQSRSGGRWRTFTMRPLHPENSPLANLAAALARQDGGDAPDPEQARAIRRLLNRGDKAPAALAAHFGCGVANSICILLDQFEELFEHARLEGNTEARLVTAFLVGLAAEKPKGLHAILTMRSDHLGRCAQYEGFAETVNETQYLVPRMERPALLRAIREPAKLYGGSVAPELADRLIADAGEGQDQLPLIQHGLMRLWQRKTAKGEAPQLTLADLGESETLANMLSDHADEVMAKAAQTEADKKIVEDVFRALSGRTPEGAVIRRRCTFKELCDITGATPERLQSILAPFRADEVSFLRPYGTRDLGGDDAVDVSHEAFIRNWSKFTAPRDGFLDREAEDSLIWSSLTLGAANFRESPLNFLSFAGTRANARWLKSHDASWAARYGGDFAAVQTFIKKSREIWLAIGAAVCAATVIFYGLAGYAYVQKREAVAKSAAAMKSENIALSSLSLIAASEGSQVEAVKLALAAWPREGSAARPKLKRTVDALGRTLLNMKERLRLEGHDRPLYAAAFSPDGTRIVTASEDRTARLWDAATGELLETLKGHVSTVTAAAFSPDGTRILTASADATARLWDAASGSQLMTLSGHGDIVLSAAFSPDGKRVVTGSWDKTARLWDTATGAEIKILEGHAGYVSAAAFSPDGKRIVTASQDKTARLWDAESGLPLMMLEGHGDHVNAAAFSPDGTRIVTASADNTARLWEAATGSLLKTIQGHTGSILAVAFSPNGARIATGSRDTTARLWDAASSTPLGIFVGHGEYITSAAFSPDGARLLTASGDKTARLWDAAVLSPIATLEGHGAAINAVAASPDGTRIVTGSADKTARIWDAATGGLITTLEGHTNFVTAVAVSPDGKRIATGSYDHTVRLWDAATGSPIRILEGHTGYVGSVAFSPDGTRLVSGSHDNTARIWDVATGALHQTLRGHESFVFAATFSPDGTQIVTASGDNSARLWDAETGSLLQDFNGHLAFVVSAAFSPDGKRIVTGSWDNTARLWDAATGKPLKTLEGHVDAVTAAVFSPNGTRILTGSRDRTARLWDAMSGISIDTLSGHVGYVSSAAFSPDGRRVVTGSWDKTARIWDVSGLDQGDAFQIACHRLGGNIDLKDVEARYELDPLPPICGDHPPAPVDLRELQ